MSGCLENRAKGRDDAVYSLRAGSDPPPAGIEQTLMSKIWKGIHPHNSLQRQRKPVCNVVINRKLVSHAGV